MGAVTSWLKQPFAEDMDVLHWVLFTGLILVIACFWGFTLNLLAKEV